jgi:hypothetical protein
MKRYNISANRYNDSETVITVQAGAGTGGGYTGGG